MSELNIPLPPPKQLAEALAAGLNGQVHEAAGVNPVLVRHDNTTIESLEPYAERPYRQRGKAVLRGLDSFIGYVDRHKTGDSAIFITPDLSSLKKGAQLATAIFNYHGSNDTNHADWCDFTAALTAVPSLPYALLLEMHDAGLCEQPAFARSLERIARFCTSHSQGEIVEIARTLVLASKGDFASIDDDFSGSLDLRFNVQVRASAGTQTQKLDVPTHIRFIIPLLDGATPTEIVCRLKYRVPDHAGGKLSLGLEIEDRHWIEDACVQQVASAIGEKSGVQTFLGTFAPQQPTV